MHVYACRCGLGGAGVDVGLRVLVGVCSWRSGVCMCKWVPICGLVCVGMLVSVDVSVWACACAPWPCGFVCCGVGK